MMLKWKICKDVKYNALIQYDCLFEYIKYTISCEIK